MVIGAYFHTNLADEISTKVNLLPVGLNRSVTRSWFFWQKEWLTAVWAKKFS